MRKRFKLFGALAVTLVAAPSIATSVTPEPAFMKCVGEESERLLSSVAEPLRRSEATQRAREITVACQPKLTIPATREFSSDFAADLARRLRYKSKVRSHA